MTANQKWKETIILSRSGGQRSSVSFYLVLAYLSVPITRKIAASLAPKIGTLCDVKVTIGAIETLYWIPVSPYELP